MARGARDLIAKFDAAVPDHLRPLVLESPLLAVSTAGAEQDAVDMKRLRASIRTRCKVRIRYGDERGRETDRVIWPFAVAYFETVRLVAAWCELRQDFRHFRTDRIRSADFLVEMFPQTVKQLRDTWLEKERAERPAREWASGLAVSGGWKWRLDWHNMQADQRGRRSTSTEWRPRASCASLFRE